MLQDTPPSRKHMTHHETVGNFTVEAGSTRFGVPYVQVRGSQSGAGLLAVVDDRAVALAEAILRAHRHNRLRLDTAAATSDAAPVIFDTADEDISVAAG